MFKLFRKSNDNSQGRITIHLSPKGTPGIECSEEEMAEYYRELRSDPEVQRSLLEERLAKNDYDEYSLEKILITKPCPNTRDTESLLEGSEWSSGLIPIRLTSLLESGTPIPILVNSAFVENFLELFMLKGGSAHLVRGEGVSISNLDFDTFNLNKAKEYEVALTRVGEKEFYGVASIYSSCLSKMTKKDIDFYESINQLKKHQDGRPVVIARNKYAEEALYIVKSIAAFGGEAFIL